MKKNYKLIKTLLPLAALGSTIAPTVVLASCKTNNNSKKEETKSKTKINFGIAPNAINMNDESTPTTITCNNAPFTFKFVQTAESKLAPWYRSGYQDEEGWKWTEFKQMTGLEVTFAKGTIVQFAASLDCEDDSGSFSNKDSPCSIVITSSNPDARVHMGGNISSLILKDTPEGKTGETLDCCQYMNDYCFNSAFANSTALFEVSTNFLPNRVSSDYCYKNLFKGCTKLEVAPAINAQHTIVALSTNANAASSPYLIEALAVGACESMFEGCTNLQTAPYLPAKILGTDCYKNMFKNCSSLNNISLGYVGNFRSNYMDGWVNGVNSNGIIHYNGIDTSKTHNYEIPANFEIVQDETIKAQTVQLKLVSDSRTSKVTDSKPEFAVYKDTQAWMLHVGDFMRDNRYLSDYSLLPDFKDNPEQGWYLAGFLDAKGNEIRINRDDPTQETTMEQIATAGGTIAPVFGQSIPEADYRSFNIIANKDSVVKITAANSKNTKLFMLDSEQGKFTPITFTSGSATINVASGSVLSLAGKLANTSSKTTNIKITGDVSLTGNLNCLLDNSLITGKTIEEISTSAKVKDYNFAYYELFKGSTGITSIIEKEGELLLPDDETSASSYDSMFMGCSNLKNAPKLPATKLGVCCYWFMFKGCSSLVEAPELPATTLPGCDHSETFGGVYAGMFKDCIALTKAPTVLPAENITDLAYASMFKGCTSLKVPPIIKAKTITGEDRWPSPYDDYEYVSKGGNHYVGPMSGMFADCSNLRVIAQTGQESNLFFTCPALPSSGSKIAIFYNMFKGTGNAFASGTTPQSGLKYYYEVK